MRKAPSLYKLRHLIDMQQQTKVQMDGDWVPARPLGLDTLTNRLRLAWLVFTGRADAVIWPKGQ